MGRQIGGSIVIVDVGPVAHGGHCVARADGRVVFVRHALPGERVRVEVTERKKSYWRADAVEIIDASPDRVVAPCRFAGLCGGCDFQHVAPEAQTRLKTSVLREQLVRLAGLAEEYVRAFEVEPLPGGALGWRTRMQYAVTRDGRPGLRMHRSHDVVHIDECVIADKTINESDTVRREWPGAGVVGVVATGGGRPSVYTGRGRRRAVTVVSGPKRVTESAGGHRFTVAADAFWQVHPAAAETFVAAVTAMLAPTPGQTVWDLYAGAGLFAASLADRVGATGRVIAVESDRRCRTGANLSGLPAAEVVESTVERAVDRLPAPDSVVLDPPRSGAGAAVIDAIAKAAPTQIAYVACDPAALARDLRTLADAGYRLVGLRAFDAFPMTHHFETIAHVTR